ncbi:MAG: ABC transporter substrate-binding protein [Bacillota bacterium]
MKRCGLVLVVILLFSLLVPSLAFAQTTIKWWHWNAPERQAYFEPLLARFEKETGIKVEAEYVGWADLKEKLILSVAGGVAPDVTAVSSAWGDEVGEKGAFLDLTKLVNRDKAEFKPVFPTAFALWKTAKGEQYAFPFDLDIPALFYNKELFDAAGIAYPTDKWTWDDMLKAAIALTKDTNGDGQPDQYGFTTWYFHWATLVWANGGSLLTPDGKKPNLNTPEARQALEFYRKIFAHNVSCDMTNAKRLGSPHPPALWKAGKIGMMPAGAWAPSIWMYDTDKKQYVMDFDVAHMPLSPKGRRAVQMDGQGMAILANSKNVEAAWKFVKFLASVDVQTMSGRDLGQFPIRRDVALTEAFLPPDTPPANKKVFVEVAEYAYAYPKVPRWKDAYKIINSEVAKYAVGNESLDEALANIEKLVPPALAGTQ